MKGRINKWFRKKKSVRVFYADETRHITEHWVIPEYGMISIDNKTFCLTDEERLLSNGIPTFVCSGKIVEAINVLNPELQSVMTSDDFDTAISARVAKEIYDTVGGRIDKAMISMILSIIILVAVGGLAYFVFENITILVEKINEINQILRNISGGA